jgi:large repetitive protein
MTNITYADTHTNGTCEENYTIKRAWTAIDSCGNANNCQQFITVQDTTRPAITCPVDKTINCEANASPSNSGTATATDNCTDVVTNITYADTRTNGSCEDNYTIKRAWTAIDSCGNANNCQQFITVQDTARPAITCPVDKTINCEASTSPSNTGTAAATDNCTDVVTNITYADTRTNGSCNDNYTITRIWTAIDSCGNANDCQQIITVQDTSRPAITCPTNKTINCEASTSPSNTGTATATDNCTDVVTNITYADTRTNGSCNDNYTITRIWTAVDSCGNSNNCQQIITVQDTTRPAITCPVDKTINCEASTSPSNTGTATATDNCTDVVTNITYTDTRINGSCEDNFTIKRVWTAIDSCGNSNDCQQFITVQDTTRPAITCPVDKTINCEASISPSNTGNATATDNCTDVVTNITYADTRTTGSCEDNYTIKRVWTAIDSCGNANNCQQFITVQDTTRPSITCPVDKTINCEANKSPSNTGTATAADNCTDVVTNIIYADTRTNGTCEDNYTIKRVWTAEDSCGNANNCQQIITVQDTTRPEITCPVDKTINCEASISPTNTGTATATDNCTNAVTNITYTDTRINGTCEDNYTIKRVWTAIDSCSNANDCQQFITVQDTTRPAITCPVDKTINCEASTSPSNTGNATATDNCTDVVTNITYADTHTNGSCEDNYTITRIWTAVDSCGNANNCQQIITVQDTTRPAITCPVDKTINCEVSTSPSNTGIATATDNCTDVVTNITYADTRINGTCEDNHTIKRVWTAVDSCGNANNCQQFITVQDTTRPAITCPVDLTIDCNDSTNPSETGFPITTDNCTDTINKLSYTDVIEDGSCSGNYTIFRTWTSRDYCNNDNFCVQKISVQDTSKPSIKCPEDITINCENGIAPPFTGFSEATDSCYSENVLISFKDVRIDGNCIDNYILKRTWSAKDSCGNESTCLQTITVQNSSTPEIVCPSDITVTCEISIDTSVSGYATASDICTDVITNIKFNDIRVEGNCLDNYIIERLWTAIDSCGNVSTCIQTITVVDSTKPNVICPPDITINCNKGTSPNHTGFASADDNCTLISPKLDYSDLRIDGNCVDNFVVNRVWIAIDNCDNSSTCNQYITVQDTARPRVYCPEDLTLNCEVSLLPERTGKASAIDNCTDKVTNFTYDDVRTDGSCNDNFSLIRTWTGTDSCGNWNTCIQKIKVHDTTKPVIICPPNITISCQTSSDPETLGRATATDKCTDFISNITFNDSITPGNCLSNYVIKRNWVAKDSCSNQNNCIQKITVQDTTRPEISCPNDLTINCNDNNSPDFTGYPGTSSVCTKDLSELNYSDLIIPGICPQNYIIIRTWSVTDDCGNTNLCTQKITVQDNNAPIINCPADITLQCNESTEPSNSGFATAIDDCSDNVNLISYSDIRINGNCKDNYTIRRTWVAVDSCGNLNSCVQMIYVENTEQPLITCPKDITINCNSNTDPTITGFATATDKCSGTPTNLSYSDQITNQNCTVIISRTWLTNDSCSNLNNCVQLITIIDTIRPETLCPVNISVNCNSNISPSNTGVVTAVDNCTKSITDIRYSDSKQNGICNDNYTIVRTWIVADSCDNVNQCIQLITVQDTTRPKVFCPEDLTLNCEVSLLPERTGKASAIDNCTDKVTDFTYVDVRTDGHCPDYFSLVRTWTGIDSCGNKNVCIQYIKVHDTTKPVVICPPNVTIDCTAGRQPDSTGIALATDKCTDVISNINYSDVVTLGNCSGNFSITRTWTAIDSCGNSSRCNQLIIVRDTSKPIITCPSDVTLDCGVSTLPEKTGGPIASTKCTEAIANYDYKDVIISGNCLGNYSIQRTWIVVDSCGNNSNCVQKITIKDTIPPDIICPLDISVECNQNSNPDITGKATVKDNCNFEVRNISYSDSESGGVCNRTISRLWTAKDTCGNTGSCLQIITLVDKTKPDIVCPKPVSINCNSNILPAITGYPISSDNCNKSVTDISYADNRVNGACNDNYIIQRSWTAIDSCNNMNTCIQEITVMDTTRPKVYCPEDLTLNCEVSLLPERTGKAVSLDNCTDKVTDITYYDIRTDGNCVDNYSLIRVWTGTDSCGNSNTCIQKIKIHDTTKPVIHCPPNITLGCDLGFSPAISGKALASDKCTDVITNISHMDIVTQGSCKSSFSVSRDWYAIDSCGNSSKCNQQIVVIDTTKPSIKCPPDVTVTCGENTNPGATGLPSSKDNCLDSIVRIVFTDRFISGDCNGLSAIYRTWSSKDNCGNSNSCMQIIHLMKAGIMLEKIGIFVDVNNNGKADVGEHIVYYFYIFNSGNLALKNINVVDHSITVSGTQIPYLAPGAIDSTSFSAIYLLTQADIDLGFYKNTATVSGLDVNNQTVFYTDSEITKLKSIPEIGIAKKLKDLKNNQDGSYDLSFELKIKNNGGITLTDIQISDNLSLEFGNVVSPIPNAPGSYSIKNLVILKNSLVPVALDLAFNGDDHSNILDISKGGELAPGEEILISLNVSFIANKYIYMNQAKVTADLPEHDDPVGENDKDPDDVYDLSDSGSNATNNPATGGHNPGEPGDRGTVNDSTKVQIQTSIVEGRVFEDLNGNGLLDPGEPGIKDVEVLIYICNSIMVKKDKTDLNGKYSFIVSDVPEDYVVIFKKPSSMSKYGFTHQDMGTNDFIDSDVDQDGQGHCIRVNPGQLISDYSAGLVKLSSLGDFVWYDKNGDGIQSSGEEGITNVKVTLFDGYTKKALFNTITDSLGNYEFTDILPGVYYLQYQFSSDWVITTFKQGSNSKDSDVDNTYGYGTTGLIQLVPGVTNRNWDLGLYKCVIVSGSVWLDKNVDGIFNDKEKGKNGVTVYVINSLNKKVIDSVKTKVNPNNTLEDGYYISNCLKPGKYFIRFEVSEFYEASLPYKGINSDKDCDVTHENGPNTTKRYSFNSGDSVMHIGAGFQDKATTGDGLKSADDTKKIKEQKDIVNNDIPLNKSELNWIQLDGLFNENFTELSWITNTVVREGQFIVERRHDKDRNFVEIGHVSAVANLLNEDSEYQFDDFGVAASGTYNYRIKYISNEGKHLYSSVISIEVFIEQDWSVSIYPNPARDLLKVDLWLQSDSEVEVLVFDKTGKTLMVNPFGGFMKADNHSVVLRTSELLAGVYVLRIKTNSGIINKQFTIVK